MIATIDAGDGAAKSASAPQPAVTESAAPAPATSAPEAAGDGPAALSPSVRRAVLEHGVDPATIKGSGKDGRITKEDVVAAASKPAETRTRSGWNWVAMGKRTPYHAAAYSASPMPSCGQPMLTL